MKPIRNLSASHADAWKARALSALRSNSSLSVRLARYNAAMAKARALKAEANACDWLENLEGDDWADACEEIAASLKAKEVRHA
ncbi:MAG: hypothetical protein ACK561_17905 [Pseudomonadaceae bacterium]